MLINSLLAASEHIQKWALNLQEGARSSCLHSRALGRGSWQTRDTWKLDRVFSCTASSLMNTNIYYQSTQTTKTWWAPAFLLINTCSTCSSQSHLVLSAQKNATQAQDAAFALRHNSGLAAKAAKCFFSFGGVIIIIVVDFSLGNKCLGF